MRLALAAAAFLVAYVPSAAAQRVDTRRYLVGELNKEVVSCRFTASPGFELQHDPDGGRPHATWQVETAGSNAAHWISLVVGLLHGPGTEAPTAVFAMMQVRNEHEAFPRPIVSARILVDGKDSAIPTRLEGTLRMAPGARNTLRVIPQEGQAEALAQLLMEANTATLELLDGDRAVVRSYTWDVHRFDDDVERIQLVHWSCKSPDR